MHQGGCDLRPLLVAEREGLDIVVQSFFEPELREECGGLGRGIRLGEPVQAREVDDLFEHLHLRVQAALFGHVAELAADVAGQLLAPEGDRSAIRDEQPEDDAHRGGLAGAVAADEAGQLAAVDREGDIVENAPRAVALRDAVQLQGS